MAQVAPIGLGNLPSPLTPGQAAQDGAQLYAYNGQLYYLDSTGTAWALNAPRGDVLPTDQGLAEWNYDPAAANATGTTLTNGSVFLQRIQVRAPMKITNVWVHLTNAAVTPTASQSAVGLYSAAGTLLSGSGDTGSTLSGTPGAVSLALSSPQNVGAGFYWVALLGNASTAAKLTASVNGAANGNVGLSAAGFRFCVNGTSQTSLPASITPSSNTATGAQTFWVGVS
ncbi:hypothetical protein [Streptomyces violascens]|uniref:hypothetical protein n=1 Tax=Streptomyces violascens TaxID=67381 RepID=UPI0036749960